MSTSWSRSTARVHASDFDTSLWWARTASASCHPTEYTGFSDVIGSWKIIAMRLPRIWLSSFGFMPSSSVPR